MHFHTLVLAAFDECPKRDKVVVTSNQVQHTDYSGQNWEDCAVRCEATPGCDCWNWNPAYMICRSDTGCYVRMQIQGVIITARGSARPPPHWLG